MADRPASSTYAGEIETPAGNIEPDPAILARERGAPLLAALSERLPHASERGEIAATLAAAIAAELDELEPGEPALLSEAARLQEVGKLYVPAELLARPRAQLSPADTELLDRHFEHGRTLAIGAAVPTRACTLILHARERWDGAGPTGLAGTEIPLGSRVIAATREYLDAPLLVAEPGEPRAEGRGRLLGLSGSVLDPEIAKLASRLVAA